MAKTTTISTGIFSTVGINQKIKGTVRTSFCTAGTQVKTKKKKTQNTSRVLRDLHSFTMHFSSLTKGTLQLKLVTPITGSELKKLEKAQPLLL